MNSESKKAAITSLKSVYNSVGKTVKFISNTRGGYGSFHFNDGTTAGTHMDKPSTGMAINIPHINLYSEFGYSEIIVHPFTYENVTTLLIKEIETSNKRDDKTEAFLITQLLKDFVMGCKIHHEFKEDVSED